VRKVKWLLIVPVGAALWLEMFLWRPLEAVILLLAIFGWWDYMRRRAKLRPPY
jgi:hypothetical protein